MNYIGSKLKLLPFLETTIYETIGYDLSDKTLCDGFAGTGIVGRAFKSRVKKLVSNDCELYSFVLNRNYIGNCSHLPKVDEYIARLNAVPVINDGFIYQNYCRGESGERLYFSDYNGQKIDAVRICIEKWRQEGEISEDMYYFLLCSLLESADKVANTASVYGAYLKKLKGSAQKPMVIEPAQFETSHQSNEVYQEDINCLIDKIEGDILYLDPPYNQRQYGANYHLLNTIAEYKPFVPKGKTGMRNYYRSKYCMLREVGRELDHLVSRAKFEFIFLSYNNEGLLAFDEIKSIFEKYGRYSLVAKDYKRFKSDADCRRKHKASSTIEYIHVLRK